MKRKVRDIYGNWVWQEEEELSSSEIRNPKRREEERNEKDLQPREGSAPVSLEWRDYIALFIATLETVLLPLVIFILVIAGIAIALAFLR